MVDSTPSARQNARAALTREWMKGDPKGKLGIQMLGARPLIEKANHPVGNQSGPAQRILEVDVLCN